MLFVLSERLERPNEFSARMRPTTDQHDIIALVVSTVSIHMQVSLEYSKKSLLVLVQHDGKSAIA
jgi:hypothetical protein